jgi:hypothetical protein
VFEDRDDHLSDYGEGRDDGEGSDRPLNSALLTLITFVVLPLAAVETVQEALVGVLGVFFHRSGPRLEDDDGRDVPEMIRSAVGERLQSGTCFEKREVLVTRISVLLKEPVEMTLALVHDQRLSFTHADEILEKSTLPACPNPARTLPGARSGTPPAARPP